ncbi:predicted protein [Nematostella vectensis]|uniref:SH3 domain-containing protein n=1 Tax=Nematostella vectensis TaxID=45351 RepID=A7SPL1_NEMVE|nr:predicted protein [Nematostella vectensis]|eukprot:XP_001626424.1 predicted protein [Nematostella vectensis]
MGNEGSVPVSYGTRLLNDVKVEWKRSGKDCVYSPRDGHCAASVGSKLYVFGGVAWNVTIGEVSEMNEMLVYDLESQTWSKPVTRGDTPSSRSSATMCSVGNTLFMFGGLSRDSGWLNDLYAFNTDSMQWKAIEAKGTYPSPRDKLGSVAMGTKMLIFGGFGPKEDDEMAGPGEAEFTWFNDIFAFDTENLTWKKFMVTTVGSPTPRAAHCMCAVGFKVVIFGGKDSIARRHDTHILNTENMKWETVKTSGRQPSPRSFHSCAAVGNRMVVFGGRGLANQHFNDLHIFDVAMLSASADFSEAMKDVYEPDWSGRDVVFKLLDQLHVYYADLQEKLQDEVLGPLTAYQSQFPDIKARINKHGRKLVDYDRYRHNYEAMRAKGKGVDQKKLNQCQEEFSEAKSVYTKLHAELYEELPALYDSRIAFYVSSFQSIFTAEAIFHREAGKIKTQMNDLMDGLVDELSSGTHTSRRPFQLSSISPISDSDESEHLSNPGEVAEPLNTESAVCNDEEPRDENIEAPAFQGVEEDEGPADVQINIFVITCPYIRHNLLPRPKKVYGDVSSSLCQVLGLETLDPATNAEIPGVLYKVRATHKYNAEDDDELSFEKDDIIHVIAFDDPDEEQDEGWLLGILDSTRIKGVFPANFTKVIS